MEHLEMRRKVIIMLSIMSAMLFAALNQTIVGTSLPKIIADLGGIEYYSWVFTIFMLTSSITAILVGKLSDIYGRKPFILLGIGVFTAGSLLCGISGSILELILYRGVQGFGGGMIMSTAFTAVGDLFPPRERGRWQGIMSSVFGLASVFGPTLGGYIVDHFHWHWVFWIFLPFGLVAFAAIYFLFPSVERKEKESIDYTGSLLLTLTMVPLLLSFTWAGNQYDWASPEIIGLFAVTIVAFFLFVLTEKRVSSPVLPLDMFKNKVFTVSNIIGFFLGILRAGRNKILRSFIGAWVDLTRGTPFLVQVFIIFFILPGIGIELEAFPAALIALSNMGSSFICEIVAGGILAVPQGQREAATASGLSGYQQMRYIVLPQAMPSIIPPLVGQYVLIIKDSSVVSAIGVVDVTRVGWLTVQRIPEGLMVFGLVGLLYFAICYPLINLSNYMERRMTVGNTRL